MKQKQRMIQKGDLIKPFPDKEYFFLEDKIDEPEDVWIEVAWKDVPGVVLEVNDFDPPREYKRLRVVVNGTLGWTYSDYVRVVSFEHF